ncbi:MAG: alpha/beta hydrolase [Polaromonas sp.]|uniref:alpha/beta hydrolase n=1 Tax=Polaromonas sp. TaxID=1869339 RepID=UPI0025D97D03|nr:alpha/beta hydrolase [Polaromonas sp.]MBI2725869.1 alpha/beta hydrolase [Polaromonas sp.]
MLFNRRFILKTALTLLGGATSMSYVKFATAQSVMTLRRPIDPDLRSYLDETAAAVGPVPANLTDALRVQRGRVGMLAALKNRKTITGLPNRVETRDVRISQGLGGRLYVPAIEGPAPVMVFLHGGGWVVGSVETHDPFCRLLSEAAGIVMLSIDYRLAPEHPCPAALDDAATALRWAASHAGEWGGDPTRLALGGDSAGANLAAVTANHAHTIDIPSLCALMLLYPVTDHPLGNHPSYTENASGFGLDAGLMRWFWQQYAPSFNPRDARLSPLRSLTVVGLPPTLVATAEYDVLRDEGIAYAAKLREAGVTVTHMHAPDMHHNFPVHPGTVARFPQCDAALAGFAAWLKTAVSKE